MKKESAYQSKLIKKIEDMFPDSFVLKNNPLDVQGVPDILILFKDKWAMLEVKKTKSAKVRPNQPYYVELFNKMSFASFIFPENEEDVLKELKKVFKR